MSVLNYHGLFDIDLIEVGNGDVYFVEYNMRYVASGYGCEKLMKEADAHFIKCNNKKPYVILGNII